MSSYYLCEICDMPILWFKDGEQISEKKLY